MKKIVLINQDSGYLMIDIANTFSNAGYKVSLITGRLVVRTTALNVNIKIERIAAYKRSSVIMRLLTWITGYFQILLLIWFKYRGASLFIVSNPPFAPLIPLFCKNPFSLLVYDVYIEKPKEYLPLGKYSPLFVIWEKLHRRVFQKSQNIFTLTNGMKKALEKYSGNKKVDVVSVWTDNVFLKPLSPEINPFIKRHNLDGKFIVMYSGNIGASSGVENILDVAARIQDEKIIFVIIGEGLRKEAVLKKMKWLCLKNCLVLPWQKVETLPFSLASANLAVVSLANKSAHNAIPSKLFNYMSVGAPILCIANKTSDVYKLVHYEKIGVCYEPEQIDEMAEFITNLKEDKEKQFEYHKNAIEASKKFTSNNAKKFLNI